MGKYKPGDYIISKDKQLYRIVNLSFDITLEPHYEIKGLTKKINYLGHLAYEDIRGLTEKEVEKIGTIIPQESANEIMKVLFEEKT